MTKKEYKKMSPRQRSAWHCGSACYDCTRMDYDDLRFLISVACSYLYKVTKKGAA
jgi:hypothetical protein